MKLGSLNHGRDGVLIVVSKNLGVAVRVKHIADTLQDALDRWTDVEASLKHTYEQLNRGEIVDMFPFKESDCASPLPRAYQWADASAYVNHVELVRKARGAELPPKFWTEPLMYQGGSDTFLAPTASIPLGSDDWGLDYEAEVAVITDTVPAGTSTEQAGSHIKLLMLVNDVSLRGLIPGELEKGFGFFQSKPSSAFSPVAVTPDELGAYWQKHKLCLPLYSYVNNKLFGKPDAGKDMTFDFSRLVSHAAATRTLGAGTIIGSGTVSNKQGTEYGSAIEEGGVGYSCIAERRMIEIINTGEAKKSFLKEGDTVEINMSDSFGNSIFGSIRQTVARTSN